MKSGETPTWHRGYHAAACSIAGTACAEKVNKLLPNLQQKNPVIQIPFHFVKFLKKLLRKIAILWKTFWLHFCNHSVTAAFTLWEVAPTNLLVLITRTLSTSTLPGWTWGCTQSRWDALVTPLALLPGTGRRDPRSIPAPCHPQPRAPQWAQLCSHPLAQNHPCCIPSSQSASGWCSVKTCMPPLPWILSAASLWNPLMLSWKAGNCTESFAPESPSLLSYGRKTCKTTFVLKTPCRKTIPPKKQSPAVSVRYVGPKREATAAAPAAKAQQEMEQRAAGSTAAPQKYCRRIWMRTTCYCTLWGIRAYLHHRSGRRS